MPSLWVCPKCENDEGEPLAFDTVEDFHKHNAETHSGKKPVKDTPVAPAPPKAPPNAPPKIPLPKLTYTWVGNCYSCNTGVETIPLDVDARTKGIIVIAWCPSCKKKLSQRSVAKL